MTRSRTLWEEGHEPGRQVVALGLAVALSVVVLDAATTGALGVLFDLSFVGLCAWVALTVRPADLFVAAVLPPLVMLSVFTLLAVTEPGLIAEPDDALVQAVVTGLSTHSQALAVGYAVCLAILWVRWRAVAAPQHEDHRAKRSTSPAP